MPLLTARASTSPRWSNCGFDIDWFHLANKFAGALLKPVIVHWRDRAGMDTRCKANALTATGIGRLIYAISAELRDTLAR